MWDASLLYTLQSSRPAYDEPPRWESVLALYAGLTDDQAESLDRSLLAMITEEYRNPHSDRADMPFDDVMVNLPAGMHPDDLLCIEAAVMVAAERGLDGAIFAFNRLLRSPRWHAMYPRFHWLGREMTGLQRKLSASRAGRFLGAMLGLAAGDALGATGFPPGEWSDDTAKVLAVAAGIAQSPLDPAEAVELAAGNGALICTLPAALAYGADAAQAVRIARMTHPNPESDAAVTVYEQVVDAIVNRGAGKQEAVAAGLTAAGPLAERLGHLTRLTEPEVESTGYVVDTLEAALWCFLTTETLEDCIVRAVNLGKDTDSVGAAAGGLAGAYYGPLALPRRWSAALRHRDRLEEAAEKLYSVTHHLLRLI